MSTVLEFRNCSPLCAEMLGGTCQGEGCPYAPTSVIPWSEFDVRIVQHRRTERLVQRSFRHGYKLGFWSGVLATLGVLFLLAIIEWVA